MEYVTLNNGLKMPMVGFGVFRVPDKKECEESVYQAIKAGYRLIDTAASYTNEDAVGAGVKRAIEEGVCTRKDLFITSKMWVQDMKNYETAKRAIDASIEKSGLGYLDLYLLHQAMGDYFSAWRAMEDAYKEGKLTEGHCKALLGIEDPEKQYQAAKYIIENGETVRDVEKQAKIKKKANSTVKNRYEPIYRDIEDSFRSFFGTKVKIDAKQRSGKIIIQYSSNEDLERILGLVK